MARATTKRTRPRRSNALYDKSVFINVPFDDRYEKLFHALVFAVHDCGFLSRCALESDDGGEIRFDKLIRIIRDSRYGIHDLSRTTLDRGNRLPRFNMPLELGIFLGAKRFGSALQQRKSCLILERERFRYQEFCSDIAGQDIRAHHDQVDDAIFAVRNWLNAVRADQRVPSAKRLTSRYVRFRTELPGLCRLSHLEVDNLSFLDYRTLVAGWLKANPGS